MRIRARLAVVAAILAAPAASAAAQPAQLVTDLAVGPPSPNYSYIDVSMATQGRAFFTVETRDGVEVWASDGTTPGTQLLADVCHGACAPAIDALGVVEDVFLWKAAIPDVSTGGVSNDLMRSDGTRAGTFRLAGPGGDLAVSSDYNLRPLVANGRLFFRGTTPASGSELWRSDGTAAGTVPVTDLAPGAHGSYPGNFAVAGSTLFFSANTDDFGPQSLYALPGLDGTPIRLIELASSIHAVAAAGPRLFFLTSTATTVELWTSDGTAAGTRQVAAFPHDAGIINTWLKPAGDRVLFAADDGNRGQEVWRSDGTAAGTVRLTNLPAGSGGDSETIFPADVEALGDGVVVIDRDSAGAQLVAVSHAGQPTVVLQPHCASCDDSFYSSALQRVGARLLFERYDAQNGTQLWTTDGTTAGTTVLAAVCEGCRPAQLLPPTFDGGFFFAEDGNGTNSLRQTDGTVGGTRLVASLPAGVAPVSPEATATADRVFFAAYLPTGGYMLWTTNRTTGVTRRLAVTALQRSSSWPRNLVALGDRLLFDAQPAPLGSPTQLWSSRGSAATTEPLTAPASSTGPKGLTVAGTHGFFSVEDFGGGSRPLWRTDGTAAGTFPLIADQRLADAPLAVRGGEVFYVLDEPGATEVWKSDGTVAGTQIAFTLPAGVREPRNLTTVGNELYFVALSIDGLEVWRSDGTTAGVQRTTAFASDSALPGDPLFVKTSGGAVFSSREGNVYDPELWVTGGTPASTRKLAPGLQLYQPRRLAVADGKLYFFAHGVGVQGRGLWRTDGTDPGTVLLAPIAEPANYPVLRSAQLGGRLYFAAGEGVHGVETWSSDGTPSGTTMLTDLAPGAASSFPAWFTAAGGRLYFAAHDGLHGFELWKTDGSAAGTKLVHDVAPGPSSSFVQELTALGSSLYFSADDGIVGQELWALDLASATSCVPSETALCLGGHFRVEATWVVGDQMGAGHTVPLTADTGGFWFFGPQNVEVVLKVLDGRGVNGHQWVFYGALSDVQYYLTVTDTDTGLTRRYVNPAGELASVGDTTGFGPLGAYSTVRRSRRAGADAATPPRMRTERAAIGVAECDPAPTRLCLQGGRFAVEATWRDFAGNSGVGTAVPLTADTGWFWFFGPTNVEVILKVLDGTPVNGHHWVFYGALSSVEYTLRVTDTVLGTVRTYTNPSGNLASVADTGAF